MIGIRGYSFYHRANLAILSFLLYIIFMRLLGIDYGSKRVGIALSDEIGFFAYPYSVLKNDKNLLNNIKNICDKENVEEIVIGESLNYKKEPNAIMSEINIFKKKIEAVVKLPIHFEIETLSSAEAERVQGKNEMLDASAAALILKSYIDKNSRG